jgi:aspartate/methionine/tyrosine aminotransferase
LDYKAQVDNPEIQSLIDNVISKSNRFDKKFCYSILATKWVCIVPLSWFNSSYDGFRMTVLENDIEKYTKTLETIRDFIIEISN